MPDTPYPLGRIPRFDERSRAFRAVATADVPLRTVMHRRWLPILNQRDVGACTGFAAVGALGCKPNYRAGERRTLTEELAFRIYSRATETDPWPGSWRPDDTGSSGLDACKAARELGLITEYRWAFGLAEVLATLQDKPVMVGTRWTGDMFRPDDNGYVWPTGSSVGGHEYVLRGIDVRRKAVRCVQSWGPRWGLAGEFWLTWDVLGELLADQGDAVVPVRG